jgi:protein-tyrosine phosphatase
MLDIHTHILPGIDDGAPDLEAGVALCRELHGQGITSIVATPHWCSPRFSVEEVAIYTQWTKLTAALAEVTTLRLVLGAEHHFSGFQAVDAFIATLRPLGDSRCVLVELPDDHLPGKTWEALWAVRFAHFVPIIAHPERCKGLSGSDPNLRSFVNNGGLLQLTLGHLLGANGLRMRWKSRGLLRRFPASCLIGSDSHNLRARRPRWNELPEAWKSAVPKNLDALANWASRPL